MRGNLPDETQQVNNMTVKKVRLSLSGKVQGVFFRDFAKQNANKLGVYGYAKNLRNGELEIVARAEERKLEEFIRLCRRGPMFARVEGLKREDLETEPEEEDFFDIR
jgi:acylphosphatase